MTPTSLLTKTSFLAWMAVITVLSVVRTSPDVALRLTITSTGFVKHFAAYLLAMILGYLAYRTVRWSRLLLLCALVGLYGVALEIVQLFLTYRTFNPLDIVANLIGVALFVPIWTRLRRRGQAPSARS